MIVKFESEAYVLDNTLYIEQKIYDDIVKCNGEEVYFKLAPHSKIDFDRHAVPFVDLELQIKFKSKKDMSKFLLKI